MKTILAYTEKDGTDQTAHLHSYIRCTLTDIAEYIDEEQRPLSGCTTSLAEMDLYRTPRRHLFSWHVSERERVSN